MNNPSVLEIICYSMFGFALLMFLTWKLFIHKKEKKNKQEQIEKKDINDESEND